MSDAVTVQIATSRIPRCDRCRNLMTEEGRICERCKKEMAGCGIASGKQHEKGEGYVG